MFDCSRISLGFGITIAGINLLNYHKSPIYKSWDSLLFLRMLLAIGVKGAIYACFFPLPFIDMILNINNGPQFNRHFIPLYTYYLPEETFASFTQVEKKK